MDILYILKEGDYNIDLPYSLRSVEKFVSGYDRIIFSGYKPTWVSDDILFIPNSQTGNKWENSFSNVKSACSSPILSDDFVLFNDDFFAINPVNLTTDLNYCRGTLDSAIESYSKKVKTRWIRSHKWTKELLKNLNSSHFMNFTLHIPMIFNKHKFLEMANSPAVIECLKKNGILSYRTVYGNLNWTNPSVMEDCKPKKYEDASESLFSGQWMSVFDGVTSSLHKYPNIRKFLLENLGEKSKFEKSSPVVPYDSLIRR